MIVILSHPIKIFLLLFQHNSTVPSPSTSVGPQTKMSTNASVSNVRPLTSGHKNCSAPTIPVKNSSLSNGNHVAKDTKDNQIKPSTTKQAKTAQQKLQKQPKEKVLQATKEKETKEPETKPLSAEDKEVRIQSRIIHEYLRISYSSFLVALSEHCFNADLLELILQPLTSS